MTDLDRLIEAVEAGDWLAVLNAAAKAFPRDTADIDRRDCYYWVLDAYRNKHGLDAALRLHEALVPEWIWGRQVNGAMFVAKRPYMIRVHVGPYMPPARSWLLAILRAVKAKGEA